MPDLLKNTTLIPLNLYGKHWVGVIIEKKDSNVIISYMDSEQNEMPGLLKEVLLTQFIKIYPEFSITFDNKSVELQKRDNCGPEVIENFVSHITKGYRVEQESAVAIHSLLLEDSLIEAENTTRNRYTFWKESPCAFGKDSSVVPLKLLW